VRTFHIKENLFKKERIQMTFKRFLMPLLVMGIMLIMASAAFAQPPSISCGLSTPLGTTPRAASTGHTEPVAAGTPAVDTFTPAPGLKVSPPTPGGGTIRVTCVNAGGVGSPTDPGVVALTINFGVPITNTTTSHPQTGTQIRVLNATGDFTGANVNVNATSYSGGQVVLGLGTPNGLGVTPTTGITFSAGATSSFDVLGVLVSTNGKTGALNATLTSTGGIGITAGQGSIPVIDSILPPLKDPTVPTTLPSLPFFTGVSGGAAVLNSAGVAIKGNFVLRIEENFADMLRESAQFNGPGTTGNFPASPAADTQVQVQLNNIPPGLDISNCSATLTNQAGSAITNGSPFVDFTNITASAPILTITFSPPAGTGLDLDNVDVLWVKCATVALGTATTPLPSTPVTAQVQMAPTGAALSGTGGNLNSLTAGQVPRYQSSLQPTTGVTVVVFPPSLTTLLVSFAYVGPGYNTGLAVANTTTDPFGPAGGGATPIDGTVQFLLVKNDGTSKTYTTTTGSKGSGLTGAGIVKSGSTYVVQLSDLLSDAAFGTTFQGYIFITANFTHAHGAATIFLTDRGDQALATPMVVLPAVSTAAVRASPESLGQ
jgi:hypothetical protein